MKVVYVAGPYRAPTAWGRQQNIHRAMEVAAEVWKLNAVALCPHANSSNLDGIVPDQSFLDGTLELLRRSDAMILVDGWHDSAGTKGEIDLCERVGKPIFTSTAQLRKWLASPENHLCLAGSRERTPEPSTNPTTPATTAAASSSSTTIREVHTSSPDQPTAVFTPTSAKTRSATSRRSSNTATERCSAT